MDQNSPAHIRITRDPEVPDDFWLYARSEWGSDGITPASDLKVPIERFLARLSWLSPACREHRVGLDWDEGSRRVVGDVQRGRLALAELTNTSLIPKDVRLDERLRGSRFTRPLLDFQKRDLSLLLALPHGANFSVPGAGKTTVSYALYEAERKAGRVEQMLVVAPISAFETWINEAEQCFVPSPQIRVFVDSVNPSTEIVLVNYQRLAFNYDSLARWVQHAATLVILDEAHRMKKGRGGQWGTSCLNLAYLAERRDVLTGTPAPNAPSDLQAILEFVWPGQSSRILPQDALIRKPDSEAASRIAHSIRRLFVRTTKRELKLPHPIRKVIQVPLQGLQHEVYQALSDQYRGMFHITRRDRATLSRMGRVVMYLLEAATNPGLLAVGSSDFDPIEFHHPPLQILPGSRLADLLAEYGRYETPRKFIELGRIVKENAELGRKTLVWSNFVRNLRALERIFAGLNPAVVHGGIPTAFTSPRSEHTREQEFAKFRLDPSCKLLLANPAAVGEGISLHDVCHDAVYLDRTFNAGQYLQSVDRIHRLGLKPGVETRITFLVTDGTLDEVVDERVQMKSERLGQMLEDEDIRLMSLPDEDDYIPALDSDDDVHALLEHLRTGVEVPSLNSSV